MNNSKSWKPALSQIKKIVSSMGGQKQAAEYLKKDVATISRYCSGKAKIDYANWKLLNEFKGER